MILWFNIHLLIEWGVYMCNLSKLSQKYGIPVETLRYRIKTKKMSLKDAIYKGSYRDFYKLKDGRIIHQLLNKNQYSMFVKRIEKGMLSEEAYKDVLKCIGGKQKWNGTKYWIDGIPLSEYCRKNNLSYYAEIKKMKSLKK